MSDFKELVKNLYTSKNRELTPEKFDYIQKTYTGKEQDFVKNFYATIGEDLTEEKLNYINDTYLKKKEPSNSVSSDSQSQSLLQEGKNVLGGGVFKTMQPAPKEGTKKENAYFKQKFVGIRPTAEGNVVERIYENPMGVDVLQIAPKQREEKPKEVTVKAETKDKSLRGVKPIAPSKYDLNQQGWLLNMVSALDKGVYKTIGTTAQGLGTAFKGVTSKITGGTGEGFISDALIKFGDSYNKMIDELTPQDEEFKGSLSDQLGQALGFLGSLYMTGGLSGATKTAGSSIASKNAANLAAQAPKSLASVFKESALSTVSPSAVVGGLAMGQSEFERAKRAGATDEQAFEAFYKNAAMGSILEQIPVMHFLKRFNNATAGGVINYIKTKGVAGLTGGVEEMTTEMLQQLYANKTAKDIYNSNQDLFEGVVGSGGIGFSVGFLLNAMGANAKILRKEGKIEKAKLIESQIKEFEEKAQEKPTTNTNTVSTKIAVLGKEEGSQKSLLNLEQDFQNGLIDENEYNNGVQLIQKSISIDEKIPQELQGENRAKAIELIDSRQKLEDELKAIEEQKGIIDVAFHGSLDEKAKEIKSKIGGVNDYLDGIIGDKGLAKYVKEGDKYYKVISDGRQQTKTEITKEHFDIAELVRINEDKKQKQQSDAIPKQTAGEVPVQSETTVSEEVEGGKPKTELEETSVIEGDEKKVGEVKKSISVQTPKEVKKQQEGEVFTVGGKEYTPETKKSGVSVVLPTEKEQQVITPKVTEKEVKVAEEVEPVKEDVKEESKEVESEEKELNDLEPIDLSKKLSSKYGIALDFLGKREGKGDLTLSRIEVDESERGGGKGTKVMEELIAYADKNNKRIVLTPSTDFGATSVDRLKAFYKKFGFIENKGKNKDFTTKETMYRLPKQEVKEQPKVDAVKGAKVEIEPKINKDNLQPFTTKSKKQVVTFENGDLIVRDSKTNKEVSSKTKKKALQEYADNFDYTVGKKAPEPSEDMQFRDENELNEWIIENSENPYELATIYANQEPTSQPLSSTEKMIAEFGIGKVTNKSFERFGDRNNKGLSMAKTYFNNAEGQGIDQVALDMSNHYGVEVTPQDIVDFMVRFPNGEGTALKLVESDVALSAADKFKALTGLNLNSEIAKKAIEQQFNKLSKDEQLIAQQDYESAEQLEAAYWTEYEQTNGFTKESVSGETKSDVSRTKEGENEAELNKPTDEQAEAETIEPPSPPTTPKEEGGEETKETKKMAVLKRLLKGENVPESFKQLIRDKGLDYEVSNQSEAAQAAKGIVEDLGVDDALDLAARGDIDPSVGSAVYAESLNKLWAEERELRAKGDTKAANLIALKYAETSYDYAKKSNSGGKWNAQIAYFYKTSPMGLAIQIEKQRQETFKDWLDKNGEDAFKEAFEFIVESEKGKEFVSEQVEAARKEERKQARKKVEKKIDDFFDGMLLKGGATYAVPIPPNVWNAVVNGMREGTKAGYLVADIVSNAISDITKAIGEDWDKEKFRKEYEDKLNAVAEKGVVKEKTEQQLLEERIKNLEKQINDYKEIIEKGGGKKNKPKEDRFKDDEKVKELVKERDALRKENQRLVRASMKSEISPKEEAIKKRIEKLEEELDRVTFRKEKEKPQKGTPREKQLTEREKELMEAIAEENEKWDNEIDNARKAANEYKKLETERNRQLKRIGELNEKLDTLLKGQLPETKKVEPKKDTPEIEAIKKEIKLAEKSVRESIAYEKRIEKLEEELDRLKERKKKEKLEVFKSELSDEELALRKEIENERLAWKIEENINKLNEELQRVKDRKEKEVEPKKKRELTQAEQDIVNQIKDEQEKWDNELEPAKKAAAEIKRKKDRISELNRRINKSDFSAEAYKAKKEKDELDRELDIVKEAYNEAKKTSPEFLDKKAKQYLDRLRKKLKGLNESQKEAIIRKSIKEITQKGGLQFDEFKDIVADVLGVKKLTENEIKELESLTETINAVDDLEIEYLNDPTTEKRQKFIAAKEKSLEADKKIFEMTHNEADAMGTFRSILTLNLLSGISVVKNFAQNAIYQGLVRLPIAIVNNVVDYSLYYSSVGFNRAFGTKILKPNLNLTSAQKGYFKGYQEAIVRGYKQMIKGVDEKDYFQSTQYASRLNPMKSFKDLKSYLKGDLYLTRGQLADKALQSTLGVQAYVISRLMVYGDKPPRYGAQEAAAFQIGQRELELNDINKLKAFVDAPEKYSFLYFKKQGLSDKDAGEKAKSISKRIIDAGAKATFQNENLLNDLLSKIDEFAAIKKEDSFLKAAAKSTVGLVKTTQLPFIKTPANIAWAYIKMSNPILPLAKSFYEGEMARRSLAKGDRAKYNEYISKSQESFAMAAIGYAFSALAMSLISQGLIRVKNDDEDKLRETEGEKFFGKDNEINLGKLLGGANASDFWVDLTWFSAIGTILNTKARIMEEKKEKGLPMEEDFIADLLPTLHYSAIESMNSLVFDNGAKFLDAIKKGGNQLDNLVVSLANTFSNAVTGATLPAISKAMLPEKPNLKADNLMDRLINNQKERNIFVRWAAGMPKSKISMWGEPIKNDNSFGGVVNNLLGFEKSAANKFGAILYDDQQKTGLAGFFPPVEDNKITVNKQQVQITVDEKQDLDIFIGQARKALVSAFVYDMGGIDGVKYGDIKDPQEKVRKLNILYNQAKEYGFAKFKEKYIQYRDAEINVEEIVKESEKKINDILFKFKSKEILEKENK